MSIFYDLVRANELEDAYNIESQGYPDDEAGSLETFQYRQSQAPELFLGAYIPSDSGRKLVGYVCSTLSPETTLTHGSMSKHVPGSPSVCVHSVCISQEYRRQKLGLGLVKEYVSRLSSNNDSRSAPYARILLIAHEELRGFYEKAGFEWVGLSAVVHGARPWFEMRKLLKPDQPQTSNSNPEIAESQTLSISESTEAPSELAASQVPSAQTQTQTQTQTQSVPPGLWEALQRESSRARPAARLLASFPNAVHDVTSNGGGGDARPPESSSSANANANTNKYDLLCPRGGCGSVILKAGVATAVERASVLLEPHGHAIPAALGVLPAPPATAQWWFVRGNAMVFENIGFSKPVRETAPSGSGPMKLLACAECDLGPLGWCEEGGTEFWLACNRVGYRV